MKLFFLTFFISYFLLSCSSNKKNIEQSESHHKIAVGLIKNCDKPRALSHLLKAAQLNPKDFLIHHTLGVVYYSMGEYEKAFSEFKKVLQINPKVTEALVDMARIYIDREDIDKALKVIKKSMEDRTYPYYLKIVSLKGLAYHKKKNYKEAKKWFTEALSLPRGGNCFVYLNLGWTEYALGKFEAAEDLFKKSLSACKPEQASCEKPNYEGYFALAQLYFKKGNKKRAKYYLNLFLKKAKQESEINKAKKLLKQLS